MEGAEESQAACASRPGQPPTFDYVPLMNRLFPVPTAREFLREHRSDSPDDPLRTATEGEDLHVDSVFDQLRRPWYELSVQLLVALDDHDQTDVFRFLREDLRIRRPRDEHVAALREIVERPRLWRQPGPWGPGAYQSLVRDRRPGDASTGSSPSLTCTRTRNARLRASCTVSAP